MERSSNELRIGTLYSVQHFDLFPVHCIGTLYSVQYFDLLVKDFQFWDFSANIASSGKSYRHAAVRHAVIAF